MPLATACRRIHSLHWLTSSFLSGVGGVRLFGGSDPLSDLANVNIYAPGLVPEPQATPLQLS